MNSIRNARCRCGATVAVPAGGSARCPSCGVELRIRPALEPRGDATQPDAGAAANKNPATDDADAAVDYRVQREPAPSAFVPARGRTTAQRSRPAATQSNRVEPPRTLDEREADDSAGSFFSPAALVYPLLHPTWTRWLGLSVVVVIAATMTAAMLFIVDICLRFYALLSLLAIPTAAMGCLALWSYAIATFVLVIEESSNGEDRLRRLPSMSWWEMAPPLVRVLGAAGVAAAASFGASYPLARWSPWQETELWLLRAIVVFELFPICLVTNLVDSSVVPVRSLLTTLSRLARSAGSFAIFQIVTAFGTVACGALLFAVNDPRDWFDGGGFAWRPIFAACVEFPIPFVAWLLLYGHWLGRLVRQLSIDD